MLLPLRTIAIPSPTTYEAPQDMLIFKGAIVNNSNDPIKVDIAKNDLFLEYQITIAAQKRIITSWKVWLDKGDRLTCSSPDINTQGFGYFDIDTMDEWLDNWDNTTEWLSLFDSEVVQQSQGILMILGILI